VKYLSSTFACLILLASGLPGNAADSRKAPATPAGGGNQPVRMAQLQLSFGVPDEVVYRALTRQGFTEIEIFSRKLTKARAKACKNGKRYKVEVSPSGRIRSQTPFGGDCRSRIDAARAHAILGKRGYRNITLDVTPQDAFTGTACAKGKRYQIAMDPYGKVAKPIPLGRCNQLFPPKEIAAMLRAQGYNRISFVNERPPSYVARACFELTRLELFLTGNGKIWRQQPIGRCDPPINPRRIADVLQRQGFTRVAVIDDVLPRYVARACRSNRRIEVALNRFGEIRGERDIGACAAPLTRDQLTAKLRDEGFRRIRFIEGTVDSFLVEACHSGKRLQINFSLYGETQHERELGPCKTPRIDAIVSDIENKGLSKVRIFAEGCRRGNRVRLELDRFGTPVGAKRIGQCR